MPLTDDWPRQRATSPSEQSSRIWSWIRANAPAAAATPPIARTAAAASPAATNSQVTAFADSPSRRKSLVAYGETRRTYSRPAQCSPLFRSKISAGCVAARSSATEGVDVVIDSAPHGLFIEVQVLEHRVAVRP